MFNLKKTSTSTSPNPNASDKKKVTKPKIVATKASLAREKAINEQFLKEAAKSKSNRKRKLDQSESLADSYKSTAELLNERPAWDLRGQVKDLNEMYDLNARRLEDIMNFKRELEILKSDKESQEKTALQQAAALRTKIQELERSHSANVANLHAQQRIEFQRLEDDSINLGRKLATIEIEVTDAEHRVNILIEQVNQYNKQIELLKESIQETQNKFDNIDGEDKSLFKDIKELDSALSEVNKDIDKEEKLNETIDVTVNKIKQNLSKSDADRQRLDRKIKELETKKNSLKSK